MKHTLLVLVVATLTGPALSACTLMAPAETGSTQTVEQTDPCKAKSDAGLMGTPATDPAVPPASRMVRHIRPNSIVTMDFAEARLNIDIDANGVITGLRCG